MLLCLQTPSGCSRHLVHTLLRKYDNDYWFCSTNYGVAAEVALEAAQTEVPVISLFSVRVSPLLFCLVWFHRAQ